LKKKSTTVVLSWSKTQQSWSKQQLKVVFFTNKVGQNNNSGLNKLLIIKEKKALLE
jgi:hypothetical protein